MRRHVRRLANRLNHVRLQQHALAANRLCSKAAGQKPVTNRSHQFAAIGLIFCNKNARPLTAPPTHKTRGDERRSYAAADQPGTTIECQPGGIVAERFLMVSRGRTHTGHPFAANTSRANLCGDRSRFSTRAAAADNHSSVCGNSTLLTVEFMIATTF